MSECIGPRGTEAVDIHLDRAPQVFGQLLYMDTCAAVDIGRPLPRQHSDVHQVSLVRPAEGLVT